MLVRSSSLGSLGSSAKRASGGSGHGRGGWGLSPVDTLRQGRGLVWWKRLEIRLGQGRRLGLRTVHDGRLVTVQVGAGGLPGGGRGQEFGQVGAGQEGVSDW